MVDARKDFYAKAETNADVDSENALVWGKFVGQFLHCVLTRFIHLLFQAGLSFRPAFWLLPDAIGPTGSSTICSSENLQRLLQKN